MKNLMYIFIFAGALFVSLFSCTKEKALDPPAFTCNDTLTFVNDILPIFQTNCAVGQCHVSGSIFAPFDATDYDTLDFFINSGALLNAIQHTSAIQMPRSNPSDPTIATFVKLPDSTIQKISCWINNGFPEL